MTRKIQNEVYRLLTPRLNEIRDHYPHLINNDPLAVIEDLQYDIIGSEDYLDAVFVKLLTDVLRSEIENRKLDDYTIEILNDIQNAIFYVARQHQLLNDDQKESLEFIGEYFEQVIDDLTEIVDNIAAVNDFNIVDYRCDLIDRFNFRGFEDEAAENYYVRSLEFQINQITDTNERQGFDKNYELDTVYDMIFNCIKDFEFEDYIAQDYQGFIPDIDYIYKATKILVARGIDYADDVNLLLYTRLMQIGKKENITGITIDFFKDFIEVESNLDIDIETRKNHLERVEKYAWFAKAALRLKRKEREQIDRKGTV